MRHLSLILFLPLLLLCSFLSAEGKFINPIEDVCWECLFPIHIAGKNITPKFKDFQKYTSQPLCHCKGDLIGLPLAFWEPNRLIDVTRTPYKLIGLGGISIGKGIKKGGELRHRRGKSQSSFYHVHYYVFPLIAILDLGLDYFCEDRIPFDIAYMSEFDPFWNEEKWNTIISPEILLFANPLAQASCIVDCAAASFHKPLNKMFWCAGCQGNLYPLNGFVSDHIGGIQASSLLVHRLLAKLHAYRVLQVFNQDEYCTPHTSHRIQKISYKTQLTYPVAQTKGPCNALGRSDIIWGAGKSFPFGGEDFVYLLWTKKHCCLDPYKITKKAVAL